MRSSTSSPLSDAAARSRAAGRRRAALLTALLLTGCGGDASSVGPDAGDPAPRSRTTSSAEIDAPRRCEVTQPNGSIPPGQAGNPGSDRATYLGNGKLWTVLPPGGTVRERARRDGSIALKFPWWRAVRGRLAITGRRLDGRGPPVRSRIPGGYGPTAFQSTAIIFPTAGCWSVTGTAGSAMLRFVTLVVAA